MNPVNKHLTPERTIKLARIIKLLFTEDTVTSSEELVSGLSDIEGSADSLLNKYLPQLTAIIEKSEVSNDEIMDALFDIREELRHIIYHVRNSKYLNELLEDVTIYDE